MKLSEYSLEALEAEIKIRKQIEMIPYSQRNYTYLEECTKKYINEYNQGDNDLDYEGYFYLAAKTFYGKDVFQKLMMKKLRK
jgi:hypothetical protein